jgi:hypothetical protein
LKIRDAEKLAKAISAREASAAFARWAASTDESAVEIKHAKKAQARRATYSAMVLATADSMRPADRPVAKAAPVLASTVTAPLPRPGSGVMRAIEAETTSKAAAEPRSEVKPAVKPRTGALAR